MRLLPLTRDGAFARGLGASRDAALDLHARIDADPRFLATMRPELDIVVWAPAGETASAISARAAAHFDATARHDLHLALMELPADVVAGHWPGVAFDRESVTCLRSCLMKPEHGPWMDTIWSILDRVADEH